MMFFRRIPSFFSGLLAVPSVTRLAFGFCFGCFIFVAYMVVDEETTDDIRASAQSLFNVVIIGVGIIVGSKISTGIGELALEDGVMNYPKLFSYPMWAAVVCLILLLAFYPNRSLSIENTDSGESNNPEPSGKGDPEPDSPEDETSTEN